MPRLEFALVCAAAVEGAGGTLSVLNAGIDRIEVGGLPIVVPLTFVFKVRWDEAELGRSHPLVIAVDHADTDQDRLVSLRVETTPERRIHHAPLPLSTQMILGVPLPVASEGHHSVVLNVDGEPLAILPLIVVVQPA